MTGRHLCEGRPREVGERAGFDSESCNTKRAALKWGFQRADELPPPSRRSFSHVQRVFLPRLWRSRSTLRAVICFLPLVCALPLKFPLGVQAEGMQRSEQHSVILNDLMYINPLHRHPPTPSPYFTVCISGCDIHHRLFAGKLLNHPALACHPQRCALKGGDRAPSFFLS